VLVKTGDIIGGKTLISFGPSSINTAGKVTFFGHFSGGQGIFNQHSLIAAFGDTIEGKTLTGFGTPLAFNDAGDVAFVAGFSDDSSAIVLAKASTEDREIASLNPGILWIGLKNSDDQGTQFDLRTEVYINDTLVSDGITRCITGVTRNPNKAKEVVVAFGSISDGAFEAGDELSLKISTRIGTNPDDTKCPGHNNAVGLRLYYDAVSRPSRFGAEIAPDPLTDFFLHANDLLNDNAPTATTAQFRDSSSLNFSGGNPWKEIGTWIMILP
jgi:hypothetical protein